MRRVGAVLLIAGFAIAARAENVALGELLKARGYAEAPLERRFGNHVFTHARINGRQAALLIDTGAPTTIISPGSVGTFGLHANSNTRGAVTIFEAAPPDEIGHWQVATLQLADRTFTNIAVDIAEQSTRTEPPEFMSISKMKANAKRKDLHLYNRIEPVNGSMGLDILRRSGAVIDTARQRLYLRGESGNERTAADIGALLAGREFARIALRVNANGRLEVPAWINGHATGLIVDTGSSYTFLEKQIAASSGVFAAPMRFAYAMGGNHLEQLNRGTIKELNVGDFAMNSTEVAVADLSPGCSARTPTSSVWSISRSTSR